jgi:hypothetical protein
MAIHWIYNLRRSLINLQQITKDLQEINDLQANNYTNEEEGRNMINGLLQHRRKSEQIQCLFVYSDRSDSPFFRF